MHTLLLAQSALALSLAVGGCATAQPDAPNPTIPGSDVNTDVRHTEPLLVRTVPLNDPARIALGDSADVDRVRVRFARVVEDSRCPPDVSCVWAGRAHVELVIGGETHVLSVPGYGQDELPAEATASGLTVRVTALAGPAPNERPAGEPLAMWVEVVAVRAGE